MNDLPTDVYNLLLTLHNAWSMCQIDKSRRKICDEIYKKYVESEQPGLEDFPIPYNYNYIKLLGGDLYVNQIDWVKKTYTPIKHFIKNKEKRTEKFSKFIEPLMLQTNTGNYVIPDLLKKRFDKKEITKVSFPEFGNIYNPITYTFTNENLITFGNLIKPHTLYLTNKCIFKILVNAVEHEINMPNSDDVSYICSYISTGIGGPSSCYLILGYTTGEIFQLKYNPTTISFDAINKTRVSSYPILQIIPSRAYDSGMTCYVLDANGDVYRVGTMGELYIKKHLTGVRKMTTFIETGRFTEGMLIVTAFIQKNNVSFHYRDEVINVPIKLPIIDVSSYNNKIYYILNS